MMAPGGELVSIVNPEDAYLTIFVPASTASHQRRATRPVSSLGFISPLPARVSFVAPPGEGGKDPVLPAVQSRSLWPTWSILPSAAGAALREPRHPLLPGGALRRSGDQPPARTIRRKLKNYA